MRGRGATFAFTTLAKSYEPLAVAASQRAAQEMADIRPFACVIVWCETAKLLVTTGIVLHTDSSAFSSLLSRKAAFEFGIPAMLLANVNVSSLPHRAQPELSASASI